MNDERLWVIHRELDELEVQAGKAEIGKEQLFQKLDARYLKYRAEDDDNWILVNVNWVKADYLEQRSDIPGAIRFLEANEDIGIFPNHLSRFTNAQSLAHLYFDQADRVKALEYLQVLFAQGEVIGPDQLLNLFYLYAQIKVKDKAELGPHLVELWETVETFYQTESKGYDLDTDFVLQYVLDTREAQLEYQSLELELRQLGSREEKLARAEEYIRVGRSDYFKRKARELLEE